jgi:hypothetical protein
MTAQFVRLLQFGDSGRIERVAIDVHDGGRTRPARHNAVCRKSLAATTSLLGDSMKSIVAPVESTARYKYVHAPATRM